MFLLRKTYAETLEKRLSMVRPRKNYEELKLFQVNIRLTDSENKLANDLADQARLSVPDWFRACAFSKKRPAAKQRFVHRELFLDLSRIGNNINQLAYHANSGNPVLSEELSRLKELQEVISEIQQKLLEL